MNRLNLEERFYLHRVPQQAALCLQFPSSHYAREERWKDHQLVHEQASENSIQGVLVINLGWRNFSECISGGKLNFLVSGGGGEKREFFKEKSAKCLVAGFFR